MTVGTTKFKSVSASSAQALDEALESAKAEIRQKNEQAQFVDLKMAISQQVIVATIVWSG